MYQTVLANAEQVVDAGGWRIWSLKSKNVKFLVINSKRITDIAQELLDECQNIVPGRLPERALSNCRLNWF